MKRIFLTSSIILLVATIIFVSTAKLFWSNQSNNAPITGNKEGISVLSPKENELISSPLKIEGRVNGGGWIGFEGQVGTVKLFDEFQKELALGILTATEDWMQSAVNFETTLWFDYEKEGSGKLVFYNENPSGEPEKNKTFELPVKLSKSSSAKTTFNVYFGQRHISDFDCEKVYPYKREVPKTQTVAKAAIEELIGGPADFEKYAGVSTSINAGAKVQSLVIENGIVKVDFSEELDKNVSGSCRVLAIRAQIEKTLLQFPAIKSVVISVNGRTEDVLQP